MSRHINVKLESYRKTEINCVYIHTAGSPLVYGKLISTHSHSHTIYIHPASSTYNFHTKYKMELNVVTIVWIFKRKHIHHHIRIKNYSDRIKSVTSI